MEDVCDMQKMTSIVQIIARKRDSNWEALAMDKAALLVLVEQDKMVKHFTHFGKKIKKVWTTVYRLFLKLLQEQQKYNSMDDIDSAIWRVSSRLYKHPFISWTC